MSNEAVVGASASEAPAVSGFRHTRWFLLAYYLLSALGGVRSAWPTVPLLLDMMLPLALYDVASWWMIADARARGRSVPLLSQQWLFLAAWLLVPIYVIWSRGWRGLGYVTLHAVLGSLLAAVSMNAVAVLYHAVVPSLNAELAN
ncbi:MAG: hypothetical protein R3C20_20830 [Planctomycetaceae bacterium]